MWSGRYIATGNAADELRTGPNHVCLLLGSCTALYCTFVNNTRQLAISPWEEDGGGPLFGRGRRPLNLDPTHRTHDICGEGGVRFNRHHTKREGRAECQTAILEHLPRFRSQPLQFDRASHI